MGKAVGRSNTIDLHHQASRRGAPIPNSAPAMSAKPLIRGVGGEPCLMRCASWRSSGRTLILLQRAISFTALDTADPRRGKNSADLAGSIGTYPSDFSDMFAW